MSQEILDKLRVRMEEIEAEGTTDSDEYENLSDNYQALALDMVEADILGDDYE